MTADEPTMTDDLPDGPLPPAMKPERPRDEFGRPLPPGEANRLDLPFFDEMTLDECHAEAIRLFDAGNYFGAHEAWETCWGFAKGTDEEEFFKGLAQLGAGFTHWMRGNAHGVVALLGRAADRIGARGSPYRGLDVEAFTERLRALIELAERHKRSGEPLPELPPAPAPVTSD
ncbi:MAG: DUF309 domain-containing protein [Chloroflexi bacterium]|nr:DUF309 domain-containing protein [Chloroflexota bacterium]MDA1010983.1 DUF309 domain-containing protein [Chloroflexota bacterium]